MPSHRVSCFGFIQEINIFHEQTASAAAVAATTTRKEIIEQTAGRLQAIEFYFVSQSEKLFRSVGILVLFFS